MVGLTSQVSNKISNCMHGMHGMHGRLLMCKYTLTGIFPVGVVSGWRVMEASEVNAAALGVGNCDMAGLGCTWGMCEESISVGVAWVE